MRMACRADLPPTRLLCIEADRPAATEAVEAPRQAAQMLLLAVIVLIARIVPMQALIIMVRKPFHDVSVVQCCSERTL